jgi:hypothetical protein
LIARYVVLPLAYVVEVYTTVFQVIDVLLVTNEQLSAEGRLTVNTELLKVIFLLVRFRLGLLTIRLRVLLDSSCRLEVEEVREAATVVKLVEVRVSLMPEVVD